jgi:hypothetical protein
MRGDWCLAELSQADANLVNLDDPVDPERSLMADMSAAFYGVLIRIVTLPALSVRHVSLILR